MFPLYRKYSNNKSWFKVLNETEFEEITVLGSNYWVHTFSAKILPDRYLIKDMVDLKDGRWLAVSEKDYENFKNTCVKDFKRQN